MTWTKEDTEALAQDQGTCEACRGNPCAAGCDCLGQRAAAEIERLQALVLGLRSDLDIERGRVAGMREALDPDRVTLVESAREKPNAYRSYPGSFGKYPREKP